MNREYFKPENLKKSKKIVLDNEYELVIQTYRTKEGCWDYTKGIIRKDNKIIIEIERDYGTFPYLFVEHENKNKYFICGENYQGYNIINLTLGINNTIMSDGFENGFGFCPYEFDYSDETLYMTGCVWGGEEMCIEYDFSNPDKLPLEELSRRYTDPYHDENEEYDDEEE